MHVWHQPEISFMCLALTLGSQSASGVLTRNKGSTLHVVCCRLVGLHDVKTFDDLLGKAGWAKKGAMKTGAATSRAGSIRKVTAKHMGDGQPLTLNMQVGAVPAQGLPGILLPPQCLICRSAVRESLPSLMALSSTAAHPVLQLYVLYCPAGNDL
jgi:hypothetical protein